MGIGGFESLSVEEEECEESDMGEVDEEEEVGEEERGEGGVGWRGGIEQNFIPILVIGHNLIHIEWCFYFVYKIFSHYFLRTVCCYYCAIL